jgi:AbrB family looped-hinge helix DNA binding protein
MSGITVMSMSLTDMARKVTTKGQVTIPQEIRDALGIHPGSTVEFRIVGDEVVLHKIAGGRGAAIVARMRGRATTGMTTDEIMRLTRQ